MCYLGLEMIHYSISNTSRKFYKVLGQFLKYFSPLLALLSKFSVFVAVVVLFCFLFCFVVLLWGFLNWLKGQGYCVGWVGGKVIKAIKRYENVLLSCNLLHQLKQ